MADINLKIQATLLGIQQSTNEIAGFAKTAEGSIKRVEKAISDVGKNTATLGSTFTKVAIGFAALGPAVAAIKAVAHALAEPIEAAIHAEEAVHELSTALALTGRSAAEHGLLGFATQLSKTTKFTRSQIVETQALLENLNRLDSEGLKKATTGAADLAATLGVDLEQGARLLSGALKDGTISLRGVQLGFKKGATDAETLDNVLKGLESRIGGTAAAQATTFGGALNQLSKAFKSVESAVGGVIVGENGFRDALNLAAQTVFSVADVIKKNIDSIRVAFELLVAAVLAAAIVFGTLQIPVLVGALGAAATATYAWAAAITVAQAAATLGLSFIITALALAIKHLFDLTKATGGIGKAFQVFGAETKIIFLKVSNAIDELVIKMLQAISKIPGAAGVVKGPLEKLREEIGANDDEIANLIDQIEKLQKVAARKPPKQDFGPDPEQSRKLQDFQDKFKASSGDRIAVLEKEQRDNLKLLEEIAKKEPKLRLEVEKTKFNITKEFSKKRIEAEIEIHDKEVELFKKRFGGIAEGISLGVKAISGASAKVEQPKVDTEGPIAAERKLRDERIENVKRISGLTKEEQDARIQAITAQTVAIEAQIKKEADAKQRALDQQVAAQKAAAGLISEGIGKAVEAVLPGFGGLAKELTTLLAQGPEVVKSAIDALVQAIPTVLSNILSAVPTLITSLLTNIEPLVSGVLSSVLAGVADIVAQLPVILETLFQNIGPLIANALNLVLQGAVTILDNLLVALPDIIVSIVSGLTDIVVSLTQSLPGIITRLVERLPEFISKLVEAIPTIIGALIGALPQFIAALVLAVPQIIVALIRALPQLIVAIILAIPDIIVALVNGLITGFELIINGFIAFLRHLPFLGGLRDVTLPRVKLAEGGTVPRGFPNDSFQAGLTSGETVVPRDISDDLKAFLQEQRAARVETQDAGRPVVVNLVIGEQELARAILNLNRQGFRVA